MTDLPVHVVADLDVSQSHTLAVVVEVLENGVPIATLDDVTGGTVTLDAGSESRGRLSLDVIATPDLIPTGPDALLAPYGNELRVSRGIRFADRLDVVRLGVFRIEHVAIGSEDVLAIDGLDRSGKFVGASFETSGQVGATASTKAATGALLELLREVEPDLAYDFTPSAVQIPVVGYSEGDSRWSFCQGIATALGAELFHDREGVLVLRPQPLPGAGAPVAEFSEGEGGLLLGVQRDLSVETVFNKIIVTGESLTDPDAPVRGEAVDDNPASPTYYYSPKFGRRPYFWSNSFIGTQTQAENAAAGILARTLGAPDAITFDAIVDPARNPSDVVRIVRAAMGLGGDTGGIEDHILDSVTIPLAAGEKMSATTRATQIYA